MLTCTIQPIKLPYEIWSLILACVSVSDLAHLAQASRYLLYIAIPHLWSNIQMESLLELLPVMDPLYPELAKADMVSFQKAIILTPLIFTPVLIR